MQPAQGMLRKILAAQRVIVTGMGEGEVQLSAGDQRALANRIAQKINQNHTVMEDDVLDLLQESGGRGVALGITENELTDLIAGEIKEFFGEE